MLGKKRPWKKYARIVRKEFNSGDVKFDAHTMDSANQTRIKQGMPVRGYDMFLLGQFESLIEAEQAVDEWWALWWPKQIKSTRRA